MYRIMTWTNSKKAIATIARLQRQVNFRKLSIEEVEELTGLRGSAAEDVRAGVPNWARGRYPFGPLKPLSAAMHCCNFRKQLNK